MSVCVCTVGRDESASLRESMCVPLEGRREKTCASVSVYCYFEKLRGL